LSTSTTVGEAEPRRVTLDAAVFDKLATARPMSELLIAAGRGDGPWLRCPPGRRGGDEQFAHRAGSGELVEDRGVQVTRRGSASPTV